MIDAKLTLEVQKNGVQKTVHVKEGESAGARRLLITLTNNGSVVDVSEMTVAVYLKTPTETDLVPDTTSIEENTIVFEIPTLNEGQYFLEVAVQDDDANLIYSPTFCIQAEASLYGAYAGEDYESNTAYIIVTDDDFYTETEADAKFATKTELTTGLSGKQGTLTAGTGIVIEGNLISAISNGGGLLITISRSGTSENYTYTSDLTFSEVMATIENGCQIWIVEDFGSFPVFFPVTEAYLAFNMQTGDIVQWTLYGEHNGRYGYKFTDGSNTVTRYYTAKGAELPAVTTTDNGKIMRVINGNWVKTNLAVDSYPISGSSNPVTSGGVYTALQNIKGVIPIGTIAKSGNTVTVALAPEVTGSYIWTNWNSGEKLAFLDSGYIYYSVLNIELHDRGNDDYTLDLIVSGIGLYRILIDLATSAVTSVTEISDIGLPAVTAADNGKVLKVVDGEWAVGSIT